MQRLIENMKYRISSVKYNVRNINIWNIFFVWDRVTNRNIFDLKGNMDSIMCQDILNENLRKKNWVLIRL